MNTLLSTIVLLLAILSCDYVSTWSYNPYCYFKECCNEDWVVHKIQNLRSDIDERVYGQHLVNDALDAIAAHVSHKSRKALTLSFHGWPGSGKNYVANFIADNMFKQGTKSKYVHYFIGRIHFPTESFVNEYKLALYSWLKGNMSSCPHQLFIFDEVDKMPAGLLNIIKPLLDYKNNIDGEDYTQAIFIFLSNTGSGLINEHYEELYLSGKKREELTLKDFEHLIAKGAFNEEGGFHHSDTIKSNVIDHYIPFLPMHEQHVKMCIKDEFKKRGVLFPKEEHISDVLDYIEWGPDRSKLFSKTGCKRMDTKVGVLVQKHYRTMRTEL